MEEEDVVGTYELRNELGYLEIAILKNGQGHIAEDGDLDFSFWKIEGKEVHLGDEKFQSSIVFKLEPNGDLTEIAITSNGERKYWPSHEEGKQLTYKKLT